jgi:hypothetical protein
MWHQNSKNEVVKLNRIIHFFFLLFPHQNASLSSSSAGKPSPEGHAPAYRIASGCLRAQRISEQTYVLGVSSFVFL